MRVILPIFILAFCFSLGVNAQAPESVTIVGIDEIYLAKDDGTGSAGEPAATFITTDVPIFCVVLLNSTQPVTVKMNLVVVSVPGVKAETKVVSATYTTKDNQNRVNFTGRPHGSWVAGKYRVDIFIEGKAAGTKALLIEKPAPRKATDADAKTQKPAARPKVARLTSTIIGPPTAFNFS